MRRSPGPHRPRLRALLALTSALVCGCLAPAADATAPPRAMTSPPTATTVLPASVGFHTRSTPQTAAPLLGVVGGVPRPGSVRPLASTSAAPTLTVALSPSTSINYWYWASGVTATITGAWGNSRLVIQDFGPDGRLSKTFDPVYADGTGTATALLKADSNFPAAGVHVIRVTSAQGFVGSAPLTLLPSPGWTAKVTTNPARLSQTDWYKKEVVVTGTGFAPREPIQMHLFNPLGYGFQVAGALRADAKGVFTYTVRAANVNGMVGDWNVTLISQAGTSGTVNFTVTPGAVQSRLGTMEFTPARITTSAMESPGVAYSVSGMHPFQAFELTLRTSRGIDVDLGTFRANGEGAFSDVINSYGDISTGTYTLRMDSINVRTVVSATFVVTTDDGSVAPNPTAVLAVSRLTRLQAMDPDVGIRVRGLHLDPDSLVYLEVRDGLNHLIGMSGTSITATTTDGAGSAFFTVNPRSVPTPGTYTVRVFSDLYPPVSTQAVLTITS